MEEPGETYGYEAERARLRLQWNALETERAKVANLPKGDVDPSARERQIDQEQDEIEFALGEQYIREKREL